MRRILGIVCLISACAQAQTGIAVPRAGCYRDRGGAFRPLGGTAGSFLPGDAAATGVVSAACSESVSVVKTERTLELLDAGLRITGSWQAPAGQVLIGLPRRGTGALVYLNETNQLVRLQPGGPPRALPDAWRQSGLFEDTPLAIGSPDATHMDAVVQTSSGGFLARVSLLTGAVSTWVALPDLNGPAVLMRDRSVIYAAGSNLVIFEHGTEPRSLALPAKPISIELAGDAWVAVQLDDGSPLLAVRVERGREAVFRIPEAER